MTNYKTMTVTYTQLGPNDWQYVVTGNGRLAFGGGSFEIESLAAKHFHKHYEFYRDVCKHYEFYRDVCNLGELPP